MKAKSNELVARALSLPLLAGLVLAVTASATDKTPAVNPAPTPNRTRPNVEPPKTVLEFSASPSVEEIFRVHVFQEPLVVVGGEPTAAENSALAAALLGYAKRSGPDDFSALTDFLKVHPQSSWTAALLTDLGFEYYNTAHYSLAIEAWSNAWALAGKATDGKSVALVNRAFGELIRMDSRLGRMDEIERLLNSLGNHPLTGQASQRVNDAREALWSMKNRPEVAFRCGPLALRSIRIALNLDGASDAAIYKSASTQRGCSLPQVAELSRKIGLNYQMSFRNSGEFVVPSVVHWKVGHYAAMVRHVGELYELRDPTFGNTTWATKTALEAETSGYFLAASGPLPPGWRAVDEKEGAAVWGKGQTSGNDPQHIARNDLATGGSCPAQGMARPKIHLMDVNLNVTDNPLGYMPPVGPKVKFEFDFNLRDLFQPANFNYGNLGAQWTSDWFTYLTDNPANPLADVNLYVAGGGQRTYTGFDTNTQSFAYQQYDHNLLTRTSVNPISYQLLSGDGSKMIFSQSDGSISSSRNIFLTQEIDQQGNALTFSYNTNLCLVAVQDAIGQVTTLTYGLPSTNIGTGLNAFLLVADPYKLTSVTDPFGRTATFNYEPQPVLITKVVATDGQVFEYTNYTWGLASDTDVIGIISQFGYEAVVTSVSISGNTTRYSLINLVNSLTTPYGTTSFINTNSGNTRASDIVYPDGSRERVEYYQAYVYDTNLVQSDPALSVPTGMTTHNDTLLERDTYYWDRVASSLAYGDYSKARQYHFCHTESGALTSGALESMKSPLEGRIWFDYAGQNGAPQIIGSNTLPLHIGRVLDDGNTQLYAYGYHPFGHVTNYVDPAGRTFTFIYDTNGVDLLEARQTRLGKNELLAKMTYNSQHRPLTATDAAGQTTTYTYNARGQLLTVTNPRNDTFTLSYDSNGFLLAVDGPLPGPADTMFMTYDAYNRVRTATSVSGYTLTFDYDNLDRLSRVTFPDSTYSQYSYNILDPASYQDRAGRLTSLAHDSMRQLTSRTDPLGRTTLFDWCRCGALKSISDPMGRRTSWITDVQGRRTAKVYNDGSQVSYLYENTTSRLRQMMDERQQTTVYAYNVDDTLRSMGSGNASVVTPSVSFSYDPEYRRLVSVTDGIGVRAYSYIPISSPPMLGAGELASTAGPLANETTAYSYDKLGRPVQETADGAVTTWAFDAAGRITAISNALGAFTYGYDGSSGRLLSKVFPNGQTTTIGYANSLQDFVLQQITNASGTTPISQFGYSHDTTRGQIKSWMQQAGSQSPSLFSFGYDAADQLLSATVTNSGTLVNAFAYSYDAAGNRLTELAGGTTATSTYNALNQLNSSANATISSRTNEWDAENRLTAVNQGNLRTEFAYDGLSRLASIRQLQNGVPISLRRFVWSNNHISEERGASGTNITKRFYPQGVALESGPNGGAYYYTRDHLGSVRELTDGAGKVRARYSYDPFGRRTKLSGDLDADFGFAGMFWSSEVPLAVTHFRAYDPNLGRWLSRDPLGNAELSQGPNLYAYLQNGPVSQTDRSGLGPSPGTVSGAITIAVAVEKVYEEVGPEGAEQFAEDLGLVANRAQQAVGQIASACDAVVENAPAWLGRVQALVERVPEAVNLTQRYFAVLGDPDAPLETLEKFGFSDVGGRTLLTFPQFLVDMGMSFDEVALELSENMGITIAEARELLSFWLNGWAPQL